MTKRISGLMNYSKLTPEQPAAQSAAVSSFRDMSQDEQRRAIHSLANDGFSDHEIARLCELHVEQVRRVLSECEK